MAIQTFVADTILTAAQMNALQGNDYNQTVSTKTASYTLVAADKGTKIVMNAGATSTAITVNTSLFSAGDTLTILNTSTSGTCTITAGTATVATAGSLALGLNQGGTLYFTSAGVSVFQANGVAATASGLVFITGATFTTATNFSLPANTFSATYLNYRLIVNLTALTADADFTLRLRASGTDNTTSNYFQGTTGFTSTAATSNVGAGSASSFNVGESDAVAANGPTYNLVLDILQPNNAIRKSLVGQVSFLDKAAGAFIGRSLGLVCDIGTAVDSLTFISSVASSITGKYRVYGYSES